MVNMIIKLGEIKPSVILLEVSPDNNFKIILELLDILHSKKMHGIYISLNKTYNNLISLFKENNLNCEHCFFIDTVTKKVNNTPKREDSCLYTSSPTALTEIAIAIDQLTKLLTIHKKFLILDCLNTLAIYNKEPNALKFIHSLSLNVNKWGLLFIIVAVKSKASESLISQLIPFVDKVIKVKGNKK